VPPDDGSKVVVVPIQIDCVPETFTMGLPITVSGVETLETHPVLVEVKVNVAVPAEMPVITPESVIWATELLLLVQIPPVVGDMEVLEPIQMEVGPVKPIIGLELTVTGVVASD
jgi:hypothetical protein